MVLVCNAPESADELLAGFPRYQDQSVALRMTMHARKIETSAPLALADARYLEHKRLLDGWA
jgi:hypothetical protein